MNMRRASTIVPILLFVLIALGFGWYALRSPGIVRAQQSSSPAPAAQAPPSPQQAAPPAAPAAPASEESSAAAAQQQAQTPPGPSIKAETREVRVDVVVTDKIGNYIQDLTTKDFHLYEDNKEQPINTFSFGADPKGPIEAQRHYIVLFFDNSTMDLSDQPRARAAAVTSEPAMTSTSLFASAIVLPASIAASTASSASVPDEAQMTMSTSACVATAMSPSRPVSDASAVIAALPEPSARALRHSQLDTG